MRERPRCRGGRPEGRSSRSKCRRRGLFTCMMIALARMRRPGELGTGESDRPGTVEWDGPCSEPLAWRVAATMLRKRLGGQPMQSDAVNLTMRSWGWPLLGGSISLGAQRA
jgi:hypothetical protein